MESKINMLKKYCVARVAVMIGSFILVSSSCFGAGVSSTLANLNKDHELLTFLLQNDVVLSRVTSHCKHVTVNRYQTHGSTHFELTGFCRIKQNPPQDVDCAGYNVDAIGTVDNKIQATIRKITMTLVCSSEGRGALDRKSASIQQD